MAALSALRSGAGLVTAAVPVSAMELVAAAAPELMTWPLTATAAGEIAAANLEPEAFEALIKGKSVLAIGPGIGQAEETVAFTTRLLAATRMPVVIDADALNILANHPLLLAKLPFTNISTPAWALDADQALLDWLASKPSLLASKRTVVLTPHPGEMARLAGLTVAEVQGNRVNVARDFAQRLGVTLVLKGARTLIAHPDGRVAVNTTGNPAMAKGGSGDLLTGFIAGLLAQHPTSPAMAVEAAVYLHGLAADLAVRGADQHTLLATDSLRELASAFRFQPRGSNGYVWLQGLPAEALHAAAHPEAHQ
jgi:NAD(P)H-hydrate epimerase